MVYAVCSVFIYANDAWVLWHGKFFFFFHSDCYKRKICHLRVVIKSLILRQSSLVFVSRFWSPLVAFSCASKAISAYAVCFQLFTNEIYLFQEICHLLMEVNMTFHQVIWHNLTKFKSWRKLREQLNANFINSFTIRWGIL